jgi:hypothetical protein
MRRIFPWVLLAVVLTAIPIASTPATKETVCAAVILICICRIVEICLEEIK